MASDLPPKLIVIYKVHAINSVMYLIIFLHKLTRRNFQKFVSMQNIAILLLRPVFHFLLYIDDFRNLFEQFSKRTNLLKYKVCR